MNNKLGETLAGLRKEKDLTQKALAEQIHISDKSISRWEKGTSFPSLDNIYQLSKFYNVSFHDLLALRVENDNPDNKMVKDIIKACSEMGNKNKKMLKIALIISLIVCIFLLATTIFTKTYNKFKYYKVYFENKEFYPLYGQYIETNIRDVLYFGNIKLKDYFPNKNDTILLSLYILEDNKEKIIQTYSSLEYIYLVDSRNFIKINNFSNYFDKIYLKLKIIDKDNNIKEYKTKLKFVLDFTNNKIYHNDEYDIEDLKYPKITLSKNKIKKILLSEGYNEITYDNLWKIEKKNIILYDGNLNYINYKFIKNQLNHHYIYKISDNILDVLIYDENNTEVEKYTYDIANNKMYCFMGTCNNYKEVMELLDSKVLYLLRN